MTALPVAESVGTTVAYLDEPALIPTSLAAVPCKVGHCTNPFVVEATTPTLSAVLADNDPPGSTILGDFEVRASGQSTNVFVASSPSVSSGSTASVTVPGGVLQDDSSYEWRVGARDATSTTWSAWQQMDVDVDYPAGAPVVSMTPCDAICSPLVTSSATPSFGAKAVEADLEQLTYHFRVQTPSGAMVASGTDKEIAASDTAHWVAPVGSLTTGTYQVRVGASDARQDQNSDITWSPWIDFAVDLPAATPTSAPCGWIAADLVWDAAHSPYVVTCGIGFNQGGSLRIRPGTVVKFSQSGSLTFADGHVTAKGSVSAPIVLTSLADDSVMGDTNQDGSATSPQPGDYFSAVRFNPPSAQAAEGLTTSVISNVAFRYGARSDGGWGGGCHGSSGVLKAGSWTRLLVRHSYFEHLRCNAITAAATNDGIGGIAIENNQFAATIQGIALDQVFADTIRENVFQNADNFSSWRSNDDFDMYVGYNYFDGLSTSMDWAIDGGISRNALTLENNSWLREPSGVSWLPNNYWNVPVPVRDDECYVSGQYPAWNNHAEKLSCGPPFFSATKASVNGGYRNRVLPTSPRPPFPDAGLEADPAVPGIDPQQLMGLGDEFGVRPTGLLADPVNSATGSYVEQHVDAALPNVGYPLAIERTYNSIDTRAGLLGRGWSANIDARLDFPDSNHAVFIAGDGQRLRFHLENGAWVGGHGVTARLVEVAPGYEIRTRAQVTYSFGSAGRLTAIKDRNDEGVTLSRNGDGQVTAISGSGRSISLTYTPSGKLDTVELADGRSVDYDYTDGLLTSISDLAGDITRYDYDNDGRLVLVTNSDDVNTMRLAYDASTGRVTDQWDANNQHTTFSWDPYEEAAVMVDPRGGRWIDDYDNGFIFARVDPLGRTNFFEYDKLGQLRKARNPRGETTVMTYTPDGDIASSSGPLGKVETTYNNRHDPITSVNTKGVVSEFEYDSQGNLIRQTRTTPDNTVLIDRWTVNSRGLVTESFSTNTTTNPATTAYNTHGDVTETVSPEGRKSTFTYDTAGRLSSAVDPRGHAVGNSPANYTTTFTYNDHDQITTVTDPLGHTTNTTYDGLGRTTSVTNPRGQVTELSYDDADRVVRVDRPLQVSEEYTYDANGNNTSVADPMGRTVTYSYDLANQVTSIVGPQGAHTYTYENSGRMASAKGPGDSAAATLTYGKKGRLRTIAYPNAPNTVEVSYSYDVHGNRVAMQDKWGTVDYTYDDLDQLTSVTRAGVTFTYDYDDLGRLVTTTGPGGSREYGYDRDGLMTSARRSPTNPLASYSYDDAGNPTAATLGNGATWARGYDRAGRLSSIVETAANGAVAVDDEFTLDANGNPTSILHRNGSAPDVQDTFTYDALDRLTGVCYGVVSCAGAAALDPLTGVCNGAVSCTGALDYISWTYDKANNRTTETRPGGTTTYSYDATTGRLTGRSGLGGSVTYSYDDKGRLAGDGTTTYAYNDASMLTSSTAAGTTTTYKYDGDGRRLSTTVGASGAANTITNHWWDPVAYTLTAETDGAGALLRSYNAGLTAIGYTTASGGNYYQHKDIQGSVVAITGPDGALDQTTRFEPYGVVKSTQTLDAAGATSPIGWAGQYTQSDGRSNMRARVYDPSTGSFTAQDPVPSTTASGTYTYADANPMTSSDPYGLFSGQDLIGGVAAIAPVVATIAAAGTLTPAAPFFGPLAVLAGASGAAANAYLAWDVCQHDKGACAQAVLSSALSVAAGGVAGRLMARRLAAKTDGWLTTRLAMRDERGMVSFGPRHSPDQAALVKLAKDAKRRGGVTAEEGQTLADWATEYGLPGHGPMTHPTMGGWAATNLHVNIGPIKHIPVRP